MSRWIAAAACVLVGCSQVSSPPLAGTTASARPTSTASAPAVNFSCRLPVIESSTIGGPEVFNGGFITFPAGTLAVDPAGGFKLIGSNGDLVTDAGPVLHNDDGNLRGGVPFYDRAQHRWVPAASSQSTPDGASYAYATWDAASPSRGFVHIVNVATGTDRTIEVAVPADAMGFTVADFDSAGVYLLAGKFEQFPSGVWLLDTKTSSLKQVANLNFVQAVRDGYAWTARIDPRDPSPPQLQRSGTASNSLVRVDLATGAQTVWYYHPGAEVILAGFDSEPVVNVSDPSMQGGQSETWLVPQQNLPARLVYSGDMALYGLQADGDRLWFGANPGIDYPEELYVFTIAGGMKKVFTASTTGQAITPAGFCT